MSRLSFNKGMLVAAALLSAILMSGFSPDTSFAVSCSGAGCNGRNPVTTGCNQNAYLAAHYPFYEQPWNIIFSPYSSSSPYMNVYYSRSCGTNWIQITSNPYGGLTYKEIQVATPGGYRQVESDWGYGSSYGMMVYAPGSTAIHIWAKLTDGSSVTKATTAYMTLR
jgi:hypothetical protein